MDANEAARRRFDSSRDGRVELSHRTHAELSPEEQELAAKRQELGRLQEELADRELLLARLRAELAAFEGLYLREVGVLYAELDDWNARIAERLAADAGTDEAQSAAAQSRAQAQNSWAAAHGKAAKRGEFFPSPEVDELFRRVAKTVHPDLAAGETDRALRERLMAQANLARERGDMDALNRILDEYRSSPESVKGDSVLAELERILRQIEQVTKRLSAIDAEVAELNSSEIALLMAKVETAKAAGRDLIAEMKKGLQYRVIEVRKEFEGQSMAAQA